MLKKKKERVSAMTKWEYIRSTYGIYGWTVAEAEAAAARWTAIQEMFKNGAILDNKVGAAADNSGERQAADSACDNSDRDGSGSDVVPTDNARFDG